MSKAVVEKIAGVQDEQIEYIDVLRIFSMLSVVFLHTAAGSLRGSIGSAVWHLSNISTAVMGTSVPVFFMISGALVLHSPKTLSIEYTWKKRLVKMFVPFVIWSLAAIVYFEVVRIGTADSIQWEAVIKKLKNAPSQATTIHLWFMYALIPLYILSPLLKKMLDALTSNLVKYLLLLWLVFSSIIPTLVSLMPIRFQPLLKLNPAYNLNFMSGYLGYFIAGYFLMAYGTRLSKKLLVGIITADTLIISMGTWIKTSQTGRYSELFKVYSHVFTLVLSISLFLLARELFRDRRLSNKVSGIVKFLSQISFGVYLLHNLVVDFVSRKVMEWPANSVGTLFVAYFIILFITIAFVILLASFKPTCFIFTGVSYTSACKTCNIQYFFRKIFSELSMKKQQESHFKA
ncbi:MAG: acyltransferase [Clostridia bacterium]|nr:acyltransferase [Clostridia bacterium]